MAYLRGRLLWLCLIPAVLLLALPASSAQEAGPAPAPEAAAALETLSGTLRPEQIDAILAVLDDGQVRAAYRDSLIARAEAATAREAAAEPVAWLELYEARTSALLAATAALPGDLAVLLDRTGANGGDSVNAGRLLLSIAGLLLLGAAAYAGVRHAVRDARRRLEQGPAAGRLRRLGRGLARLALDLLEVAAFALALVIGYLTLSPQDPRAPAVLGMLIEAGVAVLLTVTVSRLLLAPATPPLRLVPLEDASARRWHRVVVGLAVVWAGGEGLTALLEVLGLPPDGLAAAEMLVGLLIAVYLVVAAWLYRQPVAAALRARLGEDSPAAGLAPRWPWLATLYLAGLWLLSLDAQIRGRPDMTGPALLSLLLVAAIPLAAHAIETGLRRLYGPEEPGAEAVPLPTLAAGGEGEGPSGGIAIEGLEGGATLGTLMRTVWLVLVAVAALATASLWGVDLAQRTGLGAAALRVLIEGTVLGLAGYLLYQMVSVAVSRQLKAALRRDRGSRAKRLATLLPLARKFILGVLVVVIALMVLSAAGVAIGPLLAGAGVVGIAIGLGAQALVTDILAGIFFLIDDAFSVGDYIEVGELRGTVEQISIRSLKLRHHRGQVHTIPFGQMPSLTNYSRDWAIMKLEFRVPPDTDLAKVKKIVKRIGAELMADPELGPSFLEPLKSQGVRRVEDNALILGIKFMSKPGEQFVIRKTAYQRIRDAFAENGIEFANKGVTVRVDATGLPGAAAAGAGGAPLIPPEAIAAAAAQALDQAERGPGGDGAPNRHPNEG